MNIYRKYEILKGSVVPRDLKKKTFLNLRYETLKISSFEKTKRFPPTVFCVKATLH